MKNPSSPPRSIARLRRDGVALVLFSLFATLTASVQADENNGAAAPLSVPADASYVQADHAIRIVGSDGMASLVDQLDTLFTRQHPEFHFAPSMKGSSTAIPALSAGVSALAPMSREIWHGDRAVFKEMFSYEPTSIRIGYSGYGPRAGAKTPTAVYANAANPLPGLTLTQLSQLFTSGAPQGDLNLWSQLAPAAVPDVCRDRRVHLYGLRDNGGFATALRQQKLSNHPFAPTYETFDRPQQVLQAVADDICGLGLVGWVDAANWSGKVKIVPLAAKAGAPFVDASYASVADGAYPLSSYVQFYVNRVPGKPLTPWIKAYLQNALSDQGQALITAQRNGEGGYLPLSAADLARERKKLDAM